ncbi:hypothetical protein EI94DRAFT_1059069 [Lactarius quietus]|nr:hypothetical protein EI94DRAFT_1059069 [Lactarius quietus]
MQPRLQCTGTGAQRNGFLKSTSFLSPDTHPCETVSKRMRGNGSNCDAEESGTSSSTKLSIPQPDLFAACVRRGRLRAGLDRAIVRTQRLPFRTWALAWTVPFAGSVQRISVMVRLRSTKGRSTEECMQIARDLQNFDGETLAKTRRIPFQNRL